MCDEMKGFPEDTCQCSVSTAVHFLTTYITEVSIKLVTAVFTGDNGIFHAVRYGSFQRYKNVR